jgi:hypothetical protein
MMKTLQAYAAGHAKLDAKAVVKAAPYLAGSSERYLSDTFKTLKSMTMEIQYGALMMSEDATSAVWRCTIVQTRMPKNGAISIQRTDTADVALKKRDGRWVIINIQNTGG